MQLSPTTDRGAWSEWKLWTLGAGLLTGLLLVMAPQATAQDASAESAIAGAAEELLTDRFSLTPRQLEIEVNRLAGEAASVQNDVRVSASSLRRLPRGRLQVDVKEHNGSSWTERGWALLDVAHYDSVAVIETTAGSDDEVDASDLRLIWTETTRFHGEPLRADRLRELKQQDTLHATRRLTQGSTLREGDLRPSYAAETGSTVVMEYERGSLTLELRCQARQPGLVGDEIRLYNPDTEATYRARLTGPRTAEWIETL